MKSAAVMISPLFIIVAAILWSTDTLFRFPLTKELSPTLIVFGEHALGVLLFLPFLWQGLKYLRQFGRREWAAFIFVSVGGSVIATLAFTASFSHVSPSVAILLQKTQPLIALGLAAIVLRERLPKNFLAWAMVAIGGAYLISFPELTPDLSIYAGGTIGIIYALIAAFFWGGSTVFGRMVLKKMPFQHATAFRLGVGAVVLFSLLVGQGSTGLVAQITASQLWQLALIVLLPGAVALLIYYRGLTHTKASVSTIAELAFPLSAVVINWVALDQKLVPMQIIGGLILLIAITRVTLFNQRLADRYTPGVGQRQPMAVRDEMGSTTD